MTMQIIYIYIYIYIYILILGHLVFCATLKTVQHYDSLLQLKYYGNCNYSIIRSTVQIEVLLQLQLQFYNCEFTNKPITVTVTFAWLLGNYRHSNQSLSFCLYILYIFLCLIIKLDRTQSDTTSMNG